MMWGASRNAQKNFGTDTPSFVYVVSKTMFGRCVVFVDSLFWL